MKRKGWTERMDPRTPFAPRRGPVSQSISQKLDLTAAVRAAERFWIKAARLDEDRPLGIVLKLFFVVAKCPYATRSFQHGRALCRQSPARRSSVPGKELFAIFVHIPATDRRMK